MATTKAELDGRLSVLAEDENPIVHLKVRKKGAGKISTGEHDPRGGDFLYDEGETFSVRMDVASALLDRDYVDEIPAPKVEAPKDAPAGKGAAA